MTTPIEPDDSGVLEMGDVWHWFGLLPEGCEARTWLPYLDAVTIGMDPAHKITVQLPETELAALARAA